MGSIFFLKLDLKTTKLLNYCEKFRQKLLIIVEVRPSQGQTEEIEANLFGGQL